MHLYTTRGHSPYTNRPVAKFGISDRPASRLATHATNGLAHVVFCVELEDAKDIETYLKSVLKPYRPSAHEMPAGQTESFLISRESVEVFGQALEHVLPEQTLAELTEPLDDLASFAARIDAATRGEELFRSISQYVAEVQLRAMSGSLLSGHDVAADLDALRAKYLLADTVPVVEVSPPVEEVLDDLEVALRQYRDWVREARDLHPLGVFPNSTIRHIAEAKPTTLDELARVKGVGPGVVEKFGDDVLAVIEGRFDLMHTDNLGDTDGHDH